METCYEVRFGNEAVGKVQMMPEGLYVRIICRCVVPGPEIYRLFVQQGDTRQNLGVLIPEGDGLVLNKRIPVKRFGSGVPAFVVSSGRGTQTGEFVPICPEEPFLYIHRLKSSFLESEHGKVGIRVKKDPELAQTTPGQDYRSISKTTGQWSEPKTSL